MYCFHHALRGIDKWLTCSSLTTSGATFGTMKLFPLICVKIL
jgi:hypothetical protein